MSISITMHNKYYKNNPLKLKSVPVLFRKAAKPQRASLRIRPKATMPRRHRTHDVKHPYTYPYLHP